MLKCIVLDDAPAAVEGIKRYFDKVTFLELVLATTDPFVALELIKSTKIDLIFLDISMPEISGLDFAELIKNTETKIVFTTAFVEYAIQSYDYNALDYLMKPITLESFLRAAFKAKAKLLDNK